MHREIKISFYKEIEETKRCKLNIDLQYTMKRDEDYMFLKIF